MNIFYEPEINTETVHLNEEESGHAARVLRLKADDQIIVVNGKGFWCEAVFTKINARSCEVRIINSTCEFEKRNYNLHIAVAPTKNPDRLEWFVEKATEIGIDRITPLLCRYSERKNININRLGKIAIAAMKQSQKAYLPDIHDIITFNEFISVPFPGRKFIAHCYPSEKTHLKDMIAKGEDVLILIGPEGDFSREEINDAIQCGFQEISLGTSRLRTETAAIAACHIVSLCNCL